MKKYFVCSDCHSYYTILIKSLNEKGFDINNKEHYLIICGDLFDRGEESREIYNFVKSLNDRFIYIRGNHEDLLFDCVKELSDYNAVSSYHVDNGTVNTILNLCNIDSKSSKKDLDNILSLMKPVLDFIEKKSVNYYETKNYIFVHGWIPNNYDMFKFVNVDYYNPNWRNVKDWFEARWCNGMEMWKKGVREKGKTIVCGHYNSSFGNSHYHLNEHLKEYPEKNNPRFLESFKPFVDDGIIALDACTAYSGMINVLCIDENNI